MRTLLVKTGIILFCLWHMFAVAVYSVPLNVNTPWVVSLRESLRPRVMPYLFITSQWQQWNLFSPDPLRRVTSYVLQTRKNPEDAWVDFAVISRQTVPWSALSREIKFLGNLEWEEKNAPIRRAVLQTYCRMLQLPTGTPVRLVNEYYVLPELQKPESMAYWRTYRPVTTRTPDVDVHCHVTPF